MDNIAVSFIIVNWNAADVIGDCIRSIADAGVGTYEIIVTDNASSDGSVQLIEREFSCVKIVKNLLNRGFAAGCNKGASYARGKYLFFLNPDTVLKKGAAGRLIEFEEKHSWVGAAGPRLINRDGRVQNSVREFPSVIDLLIKGTILRRLFPLYKRYSLAEKIPDTEPSRADQISGAAFFIRKDLWHKIGGMDERFFMFYEEVDLCRRLWDLGFGVYYIPEAQAVHTGGASRHKDRARTIYYSVKSMFEYLRKYLPLKAVFLFGLIYKPLFLADAVVSVRNMGKRDFVKRWIREFIRF